jgi:hypothetical protein
VVEVRSAHNILVGNTEWKTPLGGPKSRLMLLKSILKKQDVRLALDSTGSE